MIMILCSTFVAITKHLYFSFSFLEFKNGNRIAFVNEVVLNKNRKDQKQKAKYKQHLERTANTQRNINSIKLDCAVFATFQNHITTIVNFRCNG